MKKIILINLLLFILPGVCLAQKETRIKVSIIDYEKISISVGGEINFGEVPTGEIRVSADTIIITNNGAQAIDLRVSLTNPNGWKAVIYSTQMPNENEYRIFGLFHQKVSTSAVSFFKAGDVITTT